MIRMATPRSRMLRMTVEHALDFGRVEAGEHLVEQQEQRLRRERPGQLEAFLPGDGELRRRRRQPVFEADEHRDLARHRAGARKRQILAPEAGADGAILQHGEVGERLHDLVRARQTVPGDAIRRLPGEIGAGEFHPPLVGRKHAVDQVEHGRLSGAVRPDQAEDFPLADGEAQLIDRPQPAEAFAQAVDLEEGRHSSTCFMRGQRP